MTVAAIEVEDVVTDVEFSAVREWKKETGRAAVGYFPVYTPVEIIDALGMLPVALHGAGDRLDLQHADARFGSFICSIVKTTMELGMTKRLDVFDSLLFSGICDSARNLCFVLKRQLPDKWIDFIHLPHNQESDATIMFLTSEYRRIADELSSIGGRPLDADALRSSIAAYEENRDLTRALYSVRADSPEALSTRELYAAIRYGDMIPVRRHNDHLLDLLIDARDRVGKRRDSIRVVIEGSFCEQPPIDLLQIIEDAGCYIVDDDFNLGRRWFRERVDLSMDDPLRALAEAYVNHSVCSSVRHDNRTKRFEALVQKVRDRRADAVVLLVAKFCEPAYFDYVLFKRELEGAGIPHLLLEFEEKMFTFDRLRNELETFVESILFA